MFTNRKPLQYTQLNRTPYFDDFDTSKKFYRILFRPARIQARELNQMQSILQNQIGRFGSHVFQEGSVVIPGGITTLMNQLSLGISLTSSTTLEELNSRIETLYIESTSTGLKAKIKKIVKSDGINPIHLFVDTINSGNSGSTKEFLVADSLKIYYETETAKVDVATANISKVTEASWVRVIAGTYFIRGHFVDTESQDIVITVDNKTELQSARVGFKVVETIVTETDDISLFSNAQGYPNFKGPGAHRLKMELSLTQKSLTDTAEDLDFIEIAKIEKAIIQEKIEDTQYSILEKTLAKRTYEESGDYTVSPFALEIKEHLKENLIDGVYTLDEGGDESKFVAQLKPGIAYVKGYRVENIGLKNITVEKARDVADINNTVAGINAGPYIVIKDLNSIPNIDIHKRISLRNSSNVVIGSFVTRGLRKFDTNVYRLYIFDLQLNSGNTLSQATNIYYSDTSDLFRATLVQSVIFDGASTALLFKLPYSTVKTLKSNGQSDTTYSVTRTFDVITGSNGTANISLSSTELFGPLNNFEYFLGYGGAGNNGTVFTDASSYLNLTGSVAGRSIDIDLGVTHANKAIKLIAPIIKQSPSEKTKTVRTKTDTFVINSSVSLLTLTKADIISVDSVLDGSSNITNLFTLDSGQKVSWYENGSLTSNTPIVGTVGSPKTITVNYSYYEHGSGDYFSVDSYIDIPRENIPSFTIDGSTLSLADCIDFRPLKINTTDYDVSSKEIIKPGDNVRCDLSYYLSRIDSIYVDSDGKFDVVKGVAADNPKTPEVPVNAMRLYDLYVPAYTSDISKIKQKYIENKRYTMRDIGKLEKRIENVEYYTLLNESESKTNKINVIDPITGNNRFKNGFATDGFSDFRLGDVDNPEWSASIDIDSAKLKPSFVQNGLDLSELSRSGTQKKTGVYTLPYTDEVLISQPLATRTSNINPYAVFVWVGSIFLNPNSDFWKDVVYNPPIIINETVNTRGAAQQGTVWNSWSTFGVSTSTSGNMFFSSTITTSVNTDQIRNGLTTTFTESFNSTSTDNYLGTQIIPFMRSIDIVWECKGFKPFTRIYPFFDGVSVSSQCLQNGKNYGDPIITDVNGYAIGHFLVPNRPDFKFRTGTSIFRFTDSPTNGTDPNELFTWGETSFSSGGTLDNRQVTVNNVRTLGVQISPTAETRRVTTRSQRNQRRERDGGGGDPIAQSFRIPTNGGAFITKIDIYFATKAKSIPVHLQVRGMDNGMPENETLPFGQVTLNPDQVNISYDGNIPTSFVFEDPLYLEDTGEFCFVLLANTQEYNVYISQMGENVIGQNMAVSKQPHTGVFMSSSNGDTWNPDQLKDIKFVIHRAKFDTSSSEHTVSFSGKPVINLPLSNNPLQSTLNSSIVTVKAKSHGIHTGQTFTLSGFVDSNGITSSAINKVQTALSVTTDYITFDCSVQANASGSIGGSLMNIISAYPISTIRATMSDLTLPNTDIRYYYSYKDVSGLNSSWIRLPLNENIDLPSEGFYKDITDFKVNAVLSSTSDNVSPCLELGGSGITLISKRVNNDLNNPIFTYVTQDIIFNNPSTTARLYVGAKLPGTSTMKVYYKLILTSDESLSSKPWVLMNPNNPLVNDSKVFTEYEYQLNNTSFIGYKFKVVLLSDDTINTPELSDFRSIALA